MSIRERRKRRKRLRINTSKKLEGWKELIVANLRNRLEEEIQRKGRETTFTKKKGAEYGPRQIYISLI